MNYSQSFAEVLEEAKKAFDEIEKSDYEKQKLRHKKREKFPILKEVGFINGTRRVAVWQ